MFNPLVSNTTKSSGHKKAVADVTSWVTEELKQIDNLYSVDKYQVMVTEIQCNEPDCVPIETLVVIMRMTESGDSVEREADAVATSHANKRKWADKILMPVKDVTRSEVHELMKTLFNPVTDQVSADFESQMEDFSSKLASLTKGYLEGADDQLAKYVANQLESAAATIRANVKVITNQSSSSLPSLQAAPQITRVTMMPTGAATPSSAPPSVASAPSSSNYTAAQTSAAANLNDMKSVVISDQAGVTTWQHAAKSVAAPVPVATTETAQLPSKPAPATVPLAAPKITIVPEALSGSTLAPRHKKGGTRPRGCPCCDPDNLDNIVDSLMFSHYPQT